MTAKKAQRASAIGELNRRVTLQEPRSISDGQGGEEDGWVNVATVWARIEDLRGLERVEAARLASIVTSHIHIRYRSDVDSSWRIVWGSTTNVDGEDIPDPDAAVYRIVALMQPDERKRFLQIEVRTD
ncbi:phage head closure protein [Nitratireductor sp. GZWM139]|uniref:phage head closure protein n=1 Tax=Nitratireductor sp. GZWM139 TaxID=2950541 RepID=UPI0024BD6327|nr:phage head closure protein [Nitratireductor sp. GZWM139]MDJ1464942.1 phage head closure protein [Nitratireductor sp. GZWM139]